MPKTIVGKIIAVNIIVFFIQVFGQIGGFEITTTFALHPGKAFEQFWCLFTSMFMHINGWHLLINMYFLYFFGRALEAACGSKKFFIFYLIVGFVSGIASSYFYTNPIIGASGAVMGVTAATIVLIPHFKVHLILPPITLKLWMIGLGLLILDLSGLMNPGNVANLAHLTGMGIGAAYGYQLKNKRRIKWARK